jgi:hypothetical protein
MKRIFVLVSLILMTVVGCVNITQPPPAPVVTPPAIVAFNASPAELKAGDSATLLWNVTGATSVTIDQSIGVVAVAGTMAVSPTQTTTYTLTATNSAGTTTQPVTLTIAGISIVPGLERRKFPPLAITETVFDFIDAAPNAKWDNFVMGVVLPFPGSESDKRGFATYKYNVKMEDGTTYARVLETHPQWVDGGVIFGWYGPLTIQPGSEFVAKAGFLDGAQGTDGVEFRIAFRESSTLKDTMLQVVPAKYDGKLDTFKTSLDPVAGKIGQILLVVQSAGTSYRDWAAWIDAKIIR